MVSRVVVVKLFCLISRCSFARIVVINFEEKMGSTSRNDVRHGMTRTQACVVVNLQSPEISTERWESPGEWS